MSDFDVYVSEFSMMSLEDIEGILNGFVECSQKTIKLFNDNIAFAKSNNYWENKVPIDFIWWCEDVPKISNTVIHDLKLVLKAVHSNSITEKEIKLVDNIFQVSFGKERESWKTFKNKEDGDWKEYGNLYFSKVEELYKEGRDYFVNLKYYMGGIAERMEDYKVTETTINNIDNSVSNIDKSMNFGDKTKIGNLVNGDNNTIKIEESSKKENPIIKFFKKYWWGVIIPLAVGVVVELIVEFIVK